MCGNHTLLQVWFRVKKHVQRRYFLLRTIGVYLTLLAGIAVSAENINIRGTVSSNSGRMINGAIVFLQGEKIADTTGSDGAYVLKKINSAVKKFSKNPNIENIAFINGSIKLNLVSPAQVTIDMFDISGNLLKRELSSYAPSGIYQYKIPAGSMATNMMTIRVTVGEHSSTFRYMQLPNGKQFSDAVSRQASYSSRMAQLEAVVDTLSVSAPNFLSKKVAVSAYDTELNIKLDTSTLSKFSFFLTSVKALRDLSKNVNGFGGDLRFGKTGQGAGLLGADSICSCIAEKSMPGAKAKQWRAFLSAKTGPDGKQVDAIDRIGSGPWYDRRGRLFANNVSELLNDRPLNADIAIKNDFPNEDGVPNHMPDPSSSKKVDNHLTITGSGINGKLYNTTKDCTCSDWTSTKGDGSATARAGLSWPQEFGGMGGMKNWMSVWDMPGCQPGIDSTDASGGGKPGVYTIGNGGGYGGFYCFGLNP
jgi:hypothetical protein